jgi:hypothetical protein
VPAASAVGVQAAAIRPTVRVNDVSIIEGDSGTQPVRFTVQLSQAANREVSVAYTTSGQTARPGRDYNATSGRLRFAPGETSKDVTVQIRGDRLIEADETFLLKLSSARNATIADRSGVCTIIDNDRPAPPTPTGTVLIDETFEDGAINGFDEIATTNGATAIVRTGDSYSSGNRFLEITYPRDESNVLLSRYNLAVNSLEVSFAQKFPDGIPISQGSPFAGVKQTRLFRSSGEPHGVNLQHELHHTRAGADGAGPNGRDELNFFFEQQDRVVRVPIELSPERWTHFRYYVRFNTPGQADGVFRLWIDGQLQANLSDVMYASDVASRPDGIFFGGNFSHSGTNPDRPFRRFLDDLRVVVNG